MPCKYKSVGTGKYKFRVVKRNSKTKRLNTIGVVWSDSIRGAKIITGRDFPQGARVSLWYS